MAAFTFKDQINETALDKCASVLLSAKSKSSFRVTLGMEITESLSHCVHT